MRSGASLVVTYYNMNHFLRIFDLAVGRTFEVHPGWRGFYSIRSLGHLLETSGFKLENRYVTRFGMQEPLLSETVAEPLRLPRYIPGGYLFAHQVIYVAAGCRMTTAYAVDPDAIGELKHHFVAAIRRAVGDSKRVAILDFPFHPNCGDSLIYLGELAALREIGVDILAVSDADGFRPQHYLSLPSDTVMLFHGGGNFGGLWDTPHILRNEELEQLRSFRAVLLPQTMTPMDDECHRRTQTVLAQHSDVTLMWRDQKSFEAGRTLFPEVPSILVPDAAFCLYPLRAPLVTLRPKEHIALLARLDREGTGLADTVDAHVLVRD